MTASSGSVTRAADFVGSLGVNTHIDFGGSYANLATVEAAIKYLGIENLRDSMQNPADLTSWQAVANATGAKFDDYIAENSVSGMATDLAYVAQLAKQGLLNFVEGGNEEDDSYPASLGNTVAATAAFQQQVYATAQSLGLPSINMSFGSGWTAANNWHGDYDKVGDLSAYATYGNAHTYPNLANDTPDSSIQQLNADAKLAASSRPVITTEIGWDENQGFTQASVANYVLDASLDGLKDGNVKTYFYALYDDGSGKFGLMYPDGTAKPAGTALHNLTTLLADSGAGATTFATGSLAYTLAGTVAADNALMLEKSDGSHWLALWDEGESAGAPHTVTLTLASAAAQILVFDPLTGTTATQATKNTASLTISIPDHPVLVEIVDAASVPVPPATTPPGGSTSSGSTGSGATGSGATTPPLMSPAPNVVLPAAASAVVGSSGAVGGVSLTDAWAAGTPGTLGLNLSVDAGSFSIRNAAGTLLTSTAAGNALSLSDTLANLNADLATLRYTGGAVGTAHLTVDLWDQAGKEGTKVLAIQVGAAPVATSPTPNPNVVLPAGAPGAVVGQAAALAGVSLSDPWAATAGGSGGLNLSIDQGSLSLKTAAGATVTANAGSGYASHLADSLANLNRDLQTLTFTGATAGTAHLTVDYWDQAGKESTKTLAVKVSAAPVATSPGTASAPNPNVVLPAAASAVVGSSGAVGGVSLTDAWAAGTPGTLGLNLSVDAGSFSIRNAAGTLLTSTAAGNALSLSDTLANLNADLATLRYTGGAVGTAHLTVDLWDQAGKEGTKVLAIQVGAAPVATSPTPNPNVVLPAGAPGAVVGQAAALAGVSLSDPWAATAGGSGGLNLSIDQGSLSLKTAAGATVTANAGSGYASHLADSLANLNRDLQTLTFTGATAGTAHLTVDYWDQAGKESTKTLAVKVSAAAAAITPQVLSAASGAPQKSFVLGSNPTSVMPAAGAAAMTLTPDFAAGTKLDFQKTLAATGWDGFGSDLSDYLKVGAAAGNATIAVDPTGAPGGATSLIATLVGQGGMTLTTLTPHAVF